MGQLTIQMIEADLAATRTALTPAKAGEAELRSGFAKAVAFYHNSKTRHHALTFHLDNGDTVFKNLGDNALEVFRIFTAARKIAVWYDEKKLVQQFVLTHEM